MVIFYSYVKLPEGIQFSIVFLMISHEKWMELSRKQTNRSVFLNHRSHMIFPYPSIFRISLYIYIQIHILCYNIYIHIYIYIYIYPCNISPFTSPWISDAYSIHCVSQATAKGAKVEPNTYRRIRFFGLITRGFQPFFHRDLKTKHGDTHGIGNGW